METTAPQHKSQTIENFLDEDLCNEILQSYWKTKSIVENTYKNPFRLTEINFKVEDNEPISLRAFRMSHGASGKGPSTVIDCNKKSKLSRKVEKANLFPYLQTIAERLESRWAEYQIPAKLHYLNILNLNQSFDIHADGVNVSKRTDGRPDTFPEYDPELYYLKDNRDFAHQGLITLENGGDRNGTIIFDQWSPYSNYLVQHLDFDNDYKANIRFYKGEKLERYGYKVHGHTGQDMPQDQFDTIQEVTDGSLTKEQLFGLTLDKVCHTGKPGTLNVWAVKKYHLPIPLPASEWTKSRIMLQYETIYYPK